MISSSTPFSANHHHRKRNLQEQHCMMMGQHCCHFLFYCRESLWLVHDTHMHTLPDIFTLLDKPKLTVSDTHTHTERERERTITQRAVIGPGHGMHTYCVSETTFWTLVENGILEHLTNIMPFLLLANSNKEVKSWTCTLYPELH